MEGVQLWMVLVLSRNACYEAEETSRDSKMENADSRVQQRHWTPVNLHKLRKEAAALSKDLRE